MRVGQGQRLLPEREDHTRELPQLSGGGLERLLLCGKLRRAACGDRCEPAPDELAHGDEKARARIGQLALEGGRVLDGRLQLHPIAMQREPLPDEGHDAGRLRLEVDRRAFAAVAAGAACPDGAAAAAFAERGAAASPAGPWPAASSGIDFSYAASCARSPLGGLP